MVTLVLPAFVQWGRVQLESFFKCRKVDLIDDLLVIGGVPEGVFGVVGFQNLQLECWESVLGFDCSFDCLSS